MAEIPTMSLKTAQFTPSKITFTPYQETNPDMAILERSLERIEARKNEAVKSQSAIDSALGELQSKLNPAEDEWFENYKKDIKAQIQTSIDSGDYGNAIRTATKLAGDINNDVRIIGRVKAQEDYKKELQLQEERKNKGEISKATYDWWLSKNKYKYEDKKDSKGNVIGRGTYEPDFRPVNDINYASHALAAFKMLTPDKNITGRAGSKQNVNADDGTATSKGHSSLQQYEKITEKDILNNIEYLLSAIPDGYKQVEQSYEVYKYELDKMEKELNNLDSNSDDYRNLKEKINKRTRLITKNGSAISYEEYYARMITDSLYAEGLAYDWRTDKTEYNKGETIKSANKPNTNNTAGQYIQRSNNSSSWAGAWTRQKTDTESSQREINRAASNLTSRFK